jgi:hypothetical protein
MAGRTPTGAAISGIVAKVVASGALPTHNPSAWFAGFSRESF